MNIRIIKSDEGVDRKGGISRGFPQPLEPHCVDKKPPHFDIRSS
jgi:hypothetical protein